MRLSKKQACERLGVSLKTLDKKCKTGAIQFEKEADTVCDGWRGHARVWIILPDPAPAPIAEVPQAQAIADRAPQVTVMPKISEDETFAERYLAGEATDSIGNTIDTVPRKSLLGPNGDIDKNAPKADLQSHMSPALLSNSGPSERHSFDKGLSDDELAKMKTEWRRRGGGASMSEQRERQERARAAISEAFNYARR